MGLERAPWLTMVITRRLQLCKPKEHITGTKPPVYCRIPGGGAGAGGKNRQESGDSATSKLHIYCACEKKPR